MKTIYLYLLNIFTIIFIWIFFSFISPLIAKFIIIASFLILFFKNLFKYIFIIYYIFLFLSDSRLSMLSFIPEVKPFIALIFYLICIIYFLKKFRSFSSYKYIYIIPFLCFIVLSLIFGNVDFLIFQKSISYVFLFVFSIPLIQNLITKENIIMLKVLIYSFMSILIFGIVLHYMDFEVTILNGRFRSLFGNPNGLGISLVLMFFIFQLAKTKYENLFSKNESVLIVSLLLFNLILCQSRSGILSILIFYAFNFLLNYSTILAVISVLISIVLYAFISFNFLGFIKMLNLENYVRLETLENASGRYIAWDFIWERLNFQTFFFGNGLGSTELLFKQNYSLLSKLGHEGNAHNSFLTIWYDTGFTGLLSFLFFLIMSFFKSNNFLNNLPILIGILISAFFESWMSASLNPFTILLLFIIIIIGSNSFSINE